LLSASDGKLLWKRDASGELEEFNTVEGSLPHPRP
jgi:hypothetical protein